MKFRSQSQMSLITIFQLIFPISGISPTPLCPCPTCYPHSIQGNLDKKIKPTIYPFSALNPSRIAFYGIKLDSKHDIHSFQ